uniref:BZIP domain-containing protein n=2 Tax=Phytophthora ramorum TaxID=164328 RepID=H3GPV8_PHYRM
MSNGGRMDISLQEDVQMATLEELFEFIDCCDCPMGCLKNGEARETERQSEDMAIPDCCECPERDEADAGACEHEAITMSEHSTTKSSVQASPTCIERSSFTTQTKPKRRRRRTGWSSSTGLQRRKRAELEFLRKHVKDLEAYAKQLQQRIGLVLVNGNACNWQELVVAEYVERLKAEETNRKLKRILDSQLHVSTTLNLVAEQSAIM